MLEELEGQQEQQGQPQARLRLAVVLMQDWMRAQQMERRVLVRGDSWHRSALERVTSLLAHRCLHLHLSQA